MIKQLTTCLGYSAFAELALIMFATVFVAIVLRTLLTRNDVTEQQSRILFDADGTGPDPLQAACLDTSREPGHEQ